MTLKTFTLVLRYALVAFAATVMLVSAAQAANKYKVLHYFADNPASQPYAGLVADPAGNLYGTTRVSTPDNYCGNPGCGVVYKLTRESGGAWSHGVIYRFHFSDGAQPLASLIFDSAGNLYGTTSAGGDQSGCPFGCGTVFELTPSAKGKWTEKVLYRFGPSPDVENPEAALTFDANGNLFGTGTVGGVGLNGGVFELKPPVRDGKRRCYTASQAAPTACCPRAS
jgi:uncharacterized repeat protein (TIGR03803 family)